MRWNVKCLCRSKEACYSQSGLSWSLLLPHMTLFQPMSHNSVNSVDEIFFLIWIFKLECESVPIMTFTSNYNTVYHKHIVSYCPQKAFSLLFFTALQKKKNKLTCCMSSVAVSITPQTRTERQYQNNGRIFTHSQTYKMIPVIDHVSSVSWLLMLLVNVFNSFYL